MQVRRCRAADLLARRFALLLARAALATELEGVAVVAGRTIAAAARRLIAQTELSRRRCAVSALQPRLPAFTAAAEVEPPAAVKGDVRSGGDGAAALLAQMDAMAESSVADCSIGPTMVSCQLSTWRMRGDEVLVMGGGWGVGGGGG